ncbi:MAG: hypothetical protein NTW87_12240, partial [Planctomycetota bacterium]|nr:hypothetical protein [Planctomycetota bacterium]
KEQGERWPLLALCQRWMLHVEKQQIKEAEALVDHISRQYDAGQLVASLPQDLRVRLIAAYAGGAHGANLFVQDKDRVMKLERAVKVTDLLLAHGHDRLEVRFNLVRAKHWEGDFDGAESAARDALKLAEEIPSTASWRVKMVDEYCLLLRRPGRSGASEALQVLNAHLLDAKGKPRREHLPMLVERACTYCALGQWQKAEADLVLLIQTMPPGKNEYDTWGSAHLLRGFLLERRGDPKAARDAWLAGTVEKWEAARGSPEAKVEYGMERVFAVILAALTDTLQQKHANLILDAYTEKVGSELLRGLLKVTPETLGPMWRGPRGLDCAQDIAFRRVPFPDMVGSSAALLLYDAGCRALKRTLSGEQDEFLWKTARAGFETYRKGEVGMIEAGQFATAYKGVTGFFGWSGLAGRLTPEHRGPAAYFLAFHYEDIGQPDDATMLWQTALTDAPANSVLRKLAADELRRRNRLGNAEPETKAPARP